MAWPWNPGWGRSKSLKMAPFDRPQYDSLSVCHCNNSSIFYHFWDKARYSPKIAIFFILHCIRHPCYLAGSPVIGCRRSAAIPFGIGKLEWRSYTRRWKKLDDMFSRFDKIPVCYRRTDGRTDILRQHSPRYVWHRSVKMTTDSNYCIRLSAMWQILYLSLLVTLNFDFWPSDLWS